MLIGIATAVENIDAIIKIIKGSKDISVAKNNLINKKWSIKKSSKLVNLIEKKHNIPKYMILNDIKNSMQQQIERHVGMQHPKEA